MNMRSVGFRCASVYLMFLIAIVLVGELGPASDGFSIWAMVFFFSTIPSGLIGRQVPSTVPNWVVLPLVCIANAGLIWLVVSTLCKVVRVLGKKLKEDA
jgi:hypothetical protein